MHITKGMENNKKIILLGVLLLVGCLTACGKKEPLTEEQIAEILKERDAFFLEESVPIAATHSFYLAELEQQIEGYWHYYEAYQKSRQELDEIISEWETDFLTEGTYVVGEDIPAGLYVFCGMGEDGSDKENAYATCVTEKEQYWYSPHFEISRHEAGERVWVRGTPKFAHISQFPALTAAEDGNYYGEFYRIGRDIPEGRYLVLTMNAETGECWYDTKAQPWIKPNDTSHWNVSMKSRFAYVELRLEDEYIWMVECILIPISQSPKIMPIEHIDISAKGKNKWRWVLQGEDWRQHTDNYKQPVYAEGDYIIGRDIPLGTYQIHEEVTADAGASYHEEVHPEFVRKIDLDDSQLWSGITLPNKDEAETCGWKTVRVSDRLVEITDAEGNKEYKELAENSAQTVTFKEKDKGCVVRVTRALLVPEE